MNAQTGYALIYLEINVFSLILILMIGLKTRGLSRMVAQINFSLAIVSEAVFFLSDTIYVLLTSGLLPYNSVAALVCKEIYFFSTTLMCFFWFIYFECLQNTFFVRSRKLVLHSSVFVLLTAIMLVVNIFNGMFFYIDAGGTYHRGPLFILQYVFAYVYVVVACGRLLANIKKRGVPDWEELRPLAAYPVLPAFAGLLQFVFPQIPLACFTMSVMTLALYLNWVNQLISLDPLTKLNNRKQFMHFYNIAVNNADNVGRLYLMIIDVDKFKQINDVYGHTEGDAALVRVADALRHSLGKLPNRANIARYGGDEFIVLISSDQEEMVTDLKHRINDTLKELNDRSGAEYDLRISIGTVKVRSGISVQTLIAEADEEMYTDKKRHKQK